MLLLTGAFSKIDNENMGVFLLTFKGKKVKMNKEKIAEQAKTYFQKIKASETVNKIRLKINKIIAFLIRLEVKWKVLIIALTFACLWIWGFIAQVAFVTTKGSFRNTYQLSINPFKCFLRIFTSGFVPFLCGLGFLLFLAAVFAIWYYRNHKDDPKTKLIIRNGKFIRVVLDDGTLNTNREMNVEELEREFFPTYQPEEENRIVFGKFPEDKRYVMMNDFKPKDPRNSILFGAAGSYKTTGYIYNLIAKNARMGENMVITDPSGEILSTTYTLLKKNGYEVKILNTQKPLHSDGWNFVAEIGDDFSLAQIFATTIIENTTAGNAKEEAYWAENMSNLLAGLILYVNQLDEKHNNIGEIVRMTTAMSLDTLTGKFKNLDPNNGARKAFEAFARAKKDVCEQILNNLCIRLKIFFGLEYQALLGTNDIHILDLTKPKTAIFIVTDELDNTYSSISALFLDASFKILGSYAKTRPGTVLIPGVHFIFDEFCNIGKIHECGQKISVARKYNIVMHMVIQSYPQLVREDRYSEKEGDEIIGNCTYKMCFSAGNLSTAKYFSELSDEMTVLTSQKTTSSPLIKTTDSLRTTLQKRPVYTPGEISSMDRKQFLMFKENCFVVLLDKVFYWNLAEFVALSDEEKSFNVTRYIGSVTKKITHKSPLYAKLQKELKENNEKNKIEESEEKKTEKENVQSVEEVTYVQPESFLDNHNEDTPNEPDEQESDSPIIPDKKEKADPKSYYFENGLPTFFVENNADEQLSIDLDTFNDTFREDESVANKVPSEKQRLSKEEILKNFKGLVYKDDNGKLRFKRGVNKDKQVYILRYCSYAECLENQLPDDQIRFEGEVINLRPITDNINLLSDNYYIDRWFVKIFNETEAYDTLLADEILEMPKKNVILVPHLKLKKDIENREEQKAVSNGPLNI